MNARYLHNLSRIGLRAYIRQTLGLKAGVPVSAISLVCPVPDKYKNAISQFFGVNPQWYKPMLGHDGIDYAVPVGTLGLAGFSGTIIKQVLSRSGYGRQSWLEDAAGNVLIYGHLHAWIFKVGITIQQGQPFVFTGGDVGDPYHGYSTGPHLHLELRPKGVSSGNGYGGAVDPLLYMSGSSSPIIPPEALMKGEVLYNGLRIRNNHSINGAILGSLNAGDPINIYGIDGSVWVCIDPVKGKWVAAKINGYEYIKIDK